MAFCVGDNDGLEDGLEYRVRELKLHLPAASFGIAQFAKADGNAVQFGSDDAEAVTAAPFDAMLEIAARDFDSITGQDADGMQHEHDGSYFHQDKRDEQCNRKMQ